MQARDFRQIKGRPETRTRQLKSQLVSKNILPLPKASQGFSSNPLLRQISYQIHVIDMIAINYQYHARLPKFRADAENPSVRR